jgi:DNA-binding response OmpR family regulator
MLGVTILVVDDDRNIYKLIKDMLSKEDLIKSGNVQYVVHYAPNLKGAMQKVKDIYFDFAIVDLRLGDEDGKDVRNFYDPTNIIFTTGYKEEAETLQKVLKYDKKDILYKPFRSIDLNIAIQRILNEKKKRPDIGSALFTIATGFSAQDDRMGRIEERLFKIEGLLQNGMCEKISNRILADIPEIIKIELNNFQCPLHKDRVNNVG